MSLIYIPEQFRALTDEEKKERERDEKQIAANQSVYDSDPEVKKLADEIHNQRMMPLPCCAQCIGYALSRLKKTPTIRGL